MWIKQAGLRVSIKDKNGTVWFFDYWSNTKADDYIQRVYFWDSGKKITGLMELKDGKTIHWKKIKDRVLKLVNDKSYREKFICHLDFPLEDHY